jgi:hypothetical protein
VALALPAVFAPELKRLLTPAGVGFAAEAIIARYFIVQYWCGGIALAHLIGEWFYFGRPMRRVNLGVVVGVNCLGLLGGLWAQPKMRALHITEYFGRTAEIQAHAAKIFGAWHAVSMTANLIVIICLAWYLWRISREQDTERFMSLSKMRG